MVDVDDRMVLFAELDDRSVSVVYALRIEPFVVSDFESSYIKWTFRRFRLFWLLYSAVVLSSRYDSDNICTLEKTKKSGGKEYSQTFIISREFLIENLCHRDYQTLPKTRKMLKIRVENEFNSYQILFVIDIIN